MTDKLREFLRKKGREGGLIGGKRRWQNVSKKERKKIMSNVRKGKEAL